METILLTIIGVVVCGSVVYEIYDMVRKPKPVDNQERINK